MADSESCDRIGASAIGLNGSSIPTSIFSPWMNFGSNFMVGVGPRVESKAPKLLFLGQRCIRRLTAQLPPSTTQHDGSRSVRLAGAVFAVGESRRKRSEP